MAEAPVILKRSRAEDPPTAAPRVALQDQEETLQAIAELALDLHQDDETFGFSAPLLELSLDPHVFVAHDSGHRVPDAAVPEWAPAFSPYISGILVREILAPSGRSGIGMGRAVLNVLQQVQTTRAGSLRADGIVIDTCHFPIFFAVDSHYHWTIEATKSVPAGTPPEALFPMYWPIEESRGSAEYMRKVEVNNKATYAFVDLHWLPPFRWAKSRIHALEWSDRKWERVAIEQIVTGMQSWLEFEQEDCSTERVFSWKNFDTIASDLQASTFLTARLGQLWPRDATSRAIAHACRLLGNNDTFIYDAGAEVSDEAAIEAYLHPFPHDVRALHLEAALVETRFLSPMNVALAAQLLLAYLVDYCRVVYRPIIMTTELMTLLLGHAPNAEEDTGEYPLGAQQPLTNPSPYFGYFPSIDRWLWLPQKKPHSTQWGGLTTIPLPLTEDPPVYDLGATRDRIAKRGRYIEAPLRCFHCAAMPERGLVGDGVFAFCDRACQTHYYCH